MMKALRRRRVCVSFTMIAVLAVTMAPASLAEGPGPTAPESPDMLRLGLRGVSFVSNEGQWKDCGVYYGFRSRGLDVAFRASSLTLHLRRLAAGLAPRDSEISKTSRDSALTSRDREGAGSPDSTSRDKTGGREGAGLPSTRAADFADPRLPHDPTRSDSLILDVSFPGSNPSVQPIGVNPQSSKFNYYIGDDASKWRTNVPAFAAIIYENLYDGIDLHVMGSDSSVLKYEFHCAPGVDYTQIRIQYAGIDSICISDSGDLLIETSFGTLRDHAPLVWQDTTTSRDSSLNEPRQNGGGEGAGSINATGTTIPAHFTVIDSYTYTITLDSPPDPSLPLVIDPDVEWMYYLGGSDSDSGRGVAVDGAGYSLITGSTDSSDFAGRNNSYYGGYRDAFVIKVSPSGIVQWMTYLGGSYSDYGWGIAVDGAGNTLVTGITYSSDFAGRNNSLNRYSNDAFVVKVGPAGAIEWMTYLGGNDSDSGESIALEGDGSTVVTGYTYSSNFAGRNNSHHGGPSDAFVVNVSPSGIVQWMTYLGGSDDDSGFGIAVDGAGDSLVTGYTRSTDFNGRNNSYYGGYRDAFVAKVDPAGALKWISYLGGSGSDGGYATALDGAGNALVAGYTESSDFAGRNNSHHGGSRDVFVVNVTPTGAVEWMTYLGGSESDSGWGIAVDGAGNALVTGTTGSTDFKGRNNSSHGDMDAFVGKVCPDGALTWMTYLGGYMSELGESIAVDGAGNLLATGWTTSTDFEGWKNLQHGGTYDAFLVKLRISDWPHLDIAATCPDGGPISVSWDSATPGGQVALIFACTTGSFTIPQGSPCTGTQLDLGPDRIHVVFHGDAGANGSRTINAIAPPSACGSYFQLVDVATCTTSNVARIE